MKISLFMAMSVNGIIATDDFSEDFLDGTWDYLVKYAKENDCIIWGRNTYQLVNNMEKKYVDSISNFKKVVLSKNLKTKLNEGDYVFESPQKIVDELSNIGLTNLLLSGGSKTNTEFAKLNLIDEVVLIVDSNIVGKGIPLFSPDNFLLKLELISANKENDHLVLLKYKVIKN